MVQILSLAKILIKHNFWTRFYLVIKFNTSIWTNFGPLCFPLVPLLYWNFHNWAMQWRNTLLEFSKALLLKKMNRPITYLCNVHFGIQVWTWLVVQTIWTLQTIFLKAPSRRLVNKELVRAFYCTEIIEHVGSSYTCSGLYDVAIICQFF